MSTLILQNLIKSHIYHLSGRAPLAQLCAQLLDFQSRFFAFSLKIRFFRIYTTKLKNLVKIRLKRLFYQSPTTIVIWIVAKLMSPEPMLLKL